MEDKTVLPPETPRDVPLGLTGAEDVAFPLRWGVIGAGRQRVLSSRGGEGATVAGVAARSGDRVEAFAARHGVERAYGGYAETLASPDVDVV